MVEKNKFLSWTGFSKPKDKKMDKVDWKKSTTSLAPSIFSRKGEKGDIREKIKFKNLTQTHRRQSSSYSSHPDDRKWTFYVNNNDNLTKTKSTDFGLLGSKHKIRTNRDLKINKNNRPITQSENVEQYFHNFQQLPKFEKTTSEVLFDQLLDTISLENIQDLMRSQTTTALNQRTHSTVSANTIDLETVDWKGVGHLNKLVTYIESLQSRDKWDKSISLEAKSKSDCFHNFSSQTRNPRCSSPTRKNVDRKDSSEVTSINSRCNTTSDRFTASDVQSDSPLSDEHSESDLQPIELPKQRKFSDSESSESNESGNFEEILKKSNQNMKIDKIIYQTLSKKLNRREAFLERPIKSKIELTSLKNRNNQDSDKHRKLTVVDVETKFKNIIDQNGKLKTRYSSDEEFLDELFEKQGITAIRTGSNKLKMTIF